MGPGLVHSCLAPLVFLLFLCHYAAAGGPYWCVANPNSTDATITAGLNYACGQVDCSPIQSGGSCNLPDDLRDHASYAFNLYYQRDHKPRSCDFGGGGFLTITDPSTLWCKYPGPSMA
ncbi:unnamed protein product [Alopecurus aequalis]